MEKSCGDALIPIPPTHPHPDFDDNFIRVEGGEGGGGTTPPIINYSTITAPL